MPNKTKLNLNELNVESFKTSEPKIKGGASFRCDTEEFVCMTEPQWCWVSWGGNPCSNHVFCTAPK